MEAGSYLHHRRYRIRRPLGRGGMGAVYLAEDLNLAGRLVAVKENLNNSEDAQRQFRREAVLLAHLRHPNLPQVIEYFVDEGGRQYLVMEYVPGENMQEYVAQNGALPVEEALACIDQVMQAVAYMHRQRDPESGRQRAIVHRDIKPSNIKRTPEGRYMLVDFGIAKVQTDTAAATALSARALTPGYAPIEQYHGGTDERSDIYALGATLYALVTGHAPPSATNMASGTPLPPPSSYNARLPGSVNKAIERAMRTQVQDRYQQVGEMYEALFARPLPTAPRTTAPAPTRSSRRPDRMMLYIGGGIVLASIAAMLLLLNMGSVENTAASAPLAAATEPAIAAVPTATPTDVPTAQAPAATPTAVEATADAEPAATVAAADTATSTSTPEAVSFPTATPLAQPGNAGGDTSPATLAASPATLAATLAAAGQPTSRPTSTSLPTFTPVPTRTPIPTRAPAPPAISAPAAAADGGPAYATITSPPDNYSSNQSATFSWTADAPLAAGQEFEVVFWGENETEDNARSWVGASEATIVQINLRNQAPGSYRWAIYLVTRDPYKRIRPLAGPYSLSIPQGSSSKDGDGFDSPLSK